MNCIYNIIIRGQKRLARWAPTLREQWSKDGAEHAQLAQTNRKGVFIATQLNWTELNSTELNWTQLDSMNNSWLSL